jgi:hypothetical protein
MLITRLTSGLPKSSPHFPLVTALIIRVFFRYMGSEVTTVHLDGLARITWVESPTNYRLEFFVSRPKLK